MYDFSEDQWTELPFLQTGRYWHACGLARKLDGTYQVVVAGGYTENSIEIFDLDTKTWRYVKINSLCNGVLTL